MKPTTATVQTEGSLGDDVTSMGIDVTKVKKIIHMLTNLYSDKILAIIREYSANAIDSHVMAGIERPIEVTLPSIGNDYKFVVEDFGLGMTATELRTRYSMYASSDKDDSNDAIGSFGVGCKSALTYTNTFTVEAVKDGTLTVAVIDKDSDGIGQTTIAYQGETDRPNGVKVIIPVKETGDFAHKARQFFRFWPEGTVLVNGQAPTHHGATLLDTWTVSDDSVLNGEYKIHYSSELEKSYVVMGNVAYPIADTYYDKVKMVAVVPIGSVTVTPSREELMYDSATDAVIALCKNRLETSILALAQNEVTKASSFAEAYKAQSKWSRILGDGIKNLKFRGHAWPTKVEMPMTIWKVHYTRYAVRNERMMFFTEWANAFVVVGKTFTSVPSSIKNKVREYMDANGISNKVVVFVEKMPDDPWAKAIVESVSYDTIKAIQLKVRLGGYGGNTKLIPGSWEQYNADGTVTEITSLDTSKPIVYVSPSTKGFVNYPSWRNRSQWKSQHEKALKYLPDDVQFLRLPANRHDKFKKQFPMATELTTWIRQKVKVASVLTPEQKEFLQMNESDKELLGKLKGQKIADPKISHAILVANRKDDLAEWRNWKMLADNYSIPFNAPAQRGTSVFSKYTLLERRYHGYAGVPTSHIVAYINATYPLLNS